MSRMVVMPVYTAAIELDGFDERTMEIAGQMKGGKNYRRESIGDWQLGRDYTALRRVTGADYALFVVIRDLRETTGRAVMNFLSGTYTYFKQVGGGLRG